MDERNDTATSNSVYTVSVWEIIAVALGAMLLVAAGLTGLGIKFIRNAFDPRRAEAIALRQMSYELPGGTRGVFGANIGSAKIAWVSSEDTLPMGFKSPNTSGLPVPKVELFLAELPADRNPEGVPFDTPDQENGNAQLSFSGISFSFESESTFEASSDRQENRLLCGVITPVTIEKGTLTWTATDVTMPAIRYEANATHENRRHLVTITAVGSDAADTAAQVFASLECQE